jgi:uncharacterized protein (TIGR02246 family)
MRVALLLFAICCGALCAAQRPTVSRAAQRAIRAGNQTWIEALKRGNASAVGDLFTGDAVNCNLTGRCLKGREAIRKEYKDILRRFGPAQAASVSSICSVQQGDLVYEWGSSRAVFRNGKEINGRYLTVWRMEGHSAWKIFRNLSLPASLGRGHAATIAGSGAGT